MKTLKIASLLPCGRAHDSIGTMNKENGGRSNH
uniref:Uncharacterized protein n=1 Tax=Setaria italica TaxID=4555 RepID=K3XU61_SETIT